MTKKIAGVEFTWYSIFIIVVTLSIFSIKGFAQDKWQPGYIIYKNSKDTLYGYTRIRTTLYGEAIKVWYRKDKEKKKGTIEFEGFPLPTSDTLRFFGHANRNYKYMNYKYEESFTTYIWGWVEILEQGKIKLSTGLCNLRFSIAGLKTTGGRAGNACVCLKKGEAPTILLDNDIPFVLSIKGFMNSGLTEWKQARLLECISDDVDLAMKWKDSTVKFGDIQKIVQEYNQWAIKNGK